MKEWTLKFTLNLLQAYFKLTLNLLQAYFLTSSLL